MQLDQMKYEDIIMGMDRLVLYGSLRKDPVFQKLYILLESIICGESISETAGKYAAFLRALVKMAEREGLTGNVLSKYAALFYLQDENIFSLTAEKDVRIQEKTLYLMALKDITLLKDLQHLDLRPIQEKIGEADCLSSYAPSRVLENDYIGRVLAGETEQEILDSLVWYYRNRGCGRYARYRMFKFDEKQGITGVAHYDSVTFEDLVGYETQKAQLIENTESFLHGQPANNVLLVGARGTGKSSCVKALANRFGDQGLCIVEFGKEQMAFLPEVLQTLKERGKYFIIFIDDLSFEEFEIQYKYLKSLLEGSVEARPANVLFYATSNRRHLIREKWSDKADALDDGDEIHTSDTVNEKLSLSDRFGLTITFPKPNPREYLAIVSKLATEMNIQLAPETLEKLALQWELGQKGLSGRTARQFIHSLRWKLLQGECCLNGENSV